jgi:hypothetical protein
MYKLVINEWNLALHEFADKLIRLLRNNLVMIIGLDEDSYIYDSNVLVVVKEVNNEVLRAVAEIAIEVNEKYGSAISCYITTEKDEKTIEIFNNAKTSKEEDCDEAFKEFYNLIKDYIIQIIYLGNKYYYDSNVLIVVKDLNVRSIIAKAAIEVNEKYDCTISYYITTEENKVLIDEFKKIRSSF